MLYTPRVNLFINCGKPSEATMIGVYHTSCVHRGLVHIYLVVDMPTWQCGDMTFMTSLLLFVATFDCAM